MIRFSLACWLTWPLVIHCQDQACQILEMSGNFILYEARYTMSEDNFGSYVFIAHIDDTLARRERLMIDSCDFVYLSNEAYANVSSSMSITETEEHIVKVGYKNLSNNYTLIRSLVADSVINYIENPPPFPSLKSATMKNGGVSSVIIKVSFFRARLLVLKYNPIPKRDFALVKFEKCLDGTLFIPTSLPARNAYLLLNVLDSQ